MENLSEFKLEEEFQRRELARRHMLSFVVKTYPNYRVNWHHRLICRKLDEWIAGKIKRLMIFTPPRHGKSLIVSERLPAFILGKNPRTKIIAASYAQELINTMSRKARTCIQSQQYRVIFPRTMVTRFERAAVQEWETSLGGSYKCAGVGGGITGFGFDFGIIDDPHKDRAEAESQTVRTTITDWYKSTFYTRKHPDARILIIQTRWHPDDLAGTLLKAAEEDPEADQWEVVDLPAILDRKPIEGDLRQQGEALWPNRFSLKTLEKIKANLGIYDWTALYQQRPMPPGGGKIKRDWFAIVDRAPESLSWHRFWDLAVSASKSADYTASISAAIDRDGNLYLRDMIRGQWEWPDVEKTIISTAKNEKIPIGIEEGGQQKGFVSGLIANPEMTEISIKGYRPDKDKLTRALPWISRAETGKIKLVRGNWINEFLNECQAFTGHNDKHDDQIDTVSGVYQMLSGPPAACVGLEVPIEVYQAKRRSFWD